MRALDGVVFAAMPSVTEQLVTLTVKAELMNHVYSRGFGGWTTQHEKDAHDSAP